jgi:hypothetical protein
VSAWKSSSKSCIPVGRPSLAAHPSGGHGGPPHRIFFGFERAAGSCATVLKRCLAIVVYAAISVYYKFLRRPLVYIISFHVLWVGRRLMRDCYEKFFCGGGDSHGLEARATGADGPLPPPPHPGTGKMPVVPVLLLKRHDRAQVQGSEHHQPEGRLGQVKEAAPRS